MNDRKRPNLSLDGQDGRPVSKAEFEAFARKIMAHKEKPQANSREHQPTRRELRQRWKLTSRD